MTLFEIVRKFENLALAAPNVRTASDGNVYEALNNNPTLKYGIFFVSQDSHQEFEQYDRYGLTLFYIDRLDDTLEDNRLQIQSIGKELLSTIIRDFCNEYDCDLPTMNYVPFTQKFKDLTAGVYVQITIEVFKDDCYDDYSEVVSDYQTKTVNITSNGTYSITPDSSHIALKEVIVNVDVQCSGCTPEQLEDAYNSGKTDQKNLLVSTAFTVNGNYTLENGWNNVTVNVPQSGYTQEDLDNAFNSGHTSGMTDQKNLLVTTAFTENGTYSRENGWNSVIVNIDTQAYYNSGYTDGYNAAQRFLVIPNSLSSSVSGTNESLAIVSNVSWSASTNDNWIVLSQYTGNGDKIISVTIASNNTGSERNGSITVTNGTNTITIPVQQDGEARPDYKGEYLTFEVLSGGSIGWANSSTSSSDDKVIQYKLNNNDWVELHSISATTFPVNSGDIIKLRADNNNYDGTGINDISFKCSDETRFNVYGNIMSLINSTNFENLLTLPSSQTFLYLFKNCKGVVNTKYLELPATALTNDCYAGMFEGCSNLITAPELPATIVSGSSYASMFSGCTSLTTAPALPATSLGQTCYANMFGGCTSLVNAPALPATTLATQCYQRMFDGCSSLTQAPALPATTLAEGCYNYMFRLCSRLTQAPSILPATTLANTCYGGMFYGCSSLVTSPELPAATLVTQCYDSMFNGCTSLNYIKCLATDISANGCTTNWVFSVASSGTFVKASSMNDWTTGVDGIPTGWTRVNNAD